MKYLFVFMMAVFMLMLLASCCSSSPENSNEGTYRAQLKSLTDGEVFIGDVDMLYNYGDTIIYPYHYKVVILANDNEYQLRVGQDTTYLYDKGRLIGAIPYSQKDKLSQLIREDNR